MASLPIISPLCQIVGGWILKIKDLQDKEGEMYETAVLEAAIKLLFSGNNFEVIERLMSMLAN